MSKGDLVVVQSYATEGEAEIAKGILESSGIHAMTQADTAGRMRDHLAWSGLDIECLCAKKTDPRRESFSPHLKTMNSWYFNVQRRFR